MRRIEINRLDTALRKSMTREKDPLTRHRFFLLGAVLCTLIVPGSVSFAQNSSAASSLPAAPEPASQATPSTTTTNASTAGPATTVNATATLGGSVGGGFPIQVPTTSSLFNQYLGSVQSRRATPEVVPLTLDSALHYGIENNLGLIYAKESVENTRAQRLQTLNVLLPNIDIRGSREVHQFNLRAQGFSPGVLPQFASLIPGGGALNFPLIVKVDVTQGQANFSQDLFNWAGLDAVRAFRSLERSSTTSALAARGTTLLNVGQIYLRVIAAQGQVKFDQALLETDRQVLYQTAQRHQAGVLANLDELRARVQAQSEEQSLIADTNILAKSKISLNRAIGFAPEQQIAVADADPFPDLSSSMTVEAGEKEAYSNRQDLVSYVEQTRAYEAERKAAFHERFPTLVFNSNYGVLGTSGGVYHDVWSATGSLNIPIFQEAKFRSDRDTAIYGLQNARAQAANLRQVIAQQVRSSLIDMRASEETLRVAQSNFELAQTALSQAVQRFEAGVEDNLASIEASSTLVQAQTQLVSATYQHNLARFNLARSLGVLSIHYHPEWQGGRPAGVLSDRAAVEYP